MSRRRVGNCPSASRIVLLPLLLALACAAGPAEVTRPPSPASGRERVLEAMVPARERGFAGPWIGALATLASTTGFLIRSSGIEDAVVQQSSSQGGEGWLLTFTLRDGTRVGGMLIENGGVPRPRPLLLASFGFLQDRWGAEARKFYERYFRGGLHTLGADVLLLDHPTSGPFLGNNGMLSVGSYDDARMWIAVAEALRDQLEPASIHALGVSMSAQTVIHVLVEDARRGLGLFDSGLAISIAPDFREAPGRQLGIMSTRQGVENPWSSSALEPPDLLDRLQRNGVWLLFRRQFLPSYRRVRPDGEPLAVGREDLPVFLRQACERRIAYLRGSPEARRGWRDEFSLASLEAYMETTRTAAVIGEVRTPLALLSARDDPAVPRALFLEVAEAARDNPWVASHETNQGGHFGFDIAYGASYLGRILRLMLDPMVLDTWNGASTARDAVGLTPRVHGHLATSGALAPGA